MMTKVARQHLIPHESPESFSPPKERQEVWIANTPGQEHPLATWMNVAPGGPRQLDRKANMTASVNGAENHQGNENRTWKTSLKVSSSQATKWTKS